MNLIIIWFLFINAATFIVYAIDKYKAVHHKWRIPEKTLILLAVAGGSIGALLAMYIVRHKTKHNKFRIGVPAILIVQLIIVYLIFKMVYGVELL